MKGRVALHHAIKHAAKTATVTHQNARRAKITVLSPLTIEVFGYEQHPLTLANDFELSQWVKLYDRVVGLRVHDRLLVDQDDVAWVVHDIVSDADVVAAFDAWDTAMGPS